MNRYEIIIHWSDEDQAFVAEAPELPGCVTHGATHQEALASIKDTMKLWLDTATELCRNIPQPLGRRLMFA